MKRLLLLGAVATAMTLTSAAAAFADPYDHDGWSSYRQHDGWRGDHREWNRDRDRDRHERRWRDHDWRREREWRRDSYVQPYSYNSGYNYSYSYPAYGYSDGYPY